jgi:malonate transporter and related proteins
MTIALLLIPDFLLILFGFLLNRMTNWGRDFWSGLEKLMYYVLFPALLFSSIASQKFDFVAAAPAVKTALITVAVAMLVAFAAKWLIKAESKTFASTFQIAFRFNAYIGLAIAGRLHGEAGIAAMGIMIGVAVPICNLAAVWMLARDTKVNIAKELMQNPLILGTVSGVAYSLSGLPIPEVVQMLISRMGAAALACGLLSVGAALTFSNAVVNAPLIGYNTAIKLLIMPITAIALAKYFSLHIESRVFYDIVILFSALPTAASAYILAVRMGGNGVIVAQSITVSTLLGMLSIPLWLTVAHMI